MKFAVLMLVVGVLVAGAGWIGRGVGYQQGAEDASCYALMATRGTSTELPPDMAPCPAARRPL
jgi:hypothetical protein